MLTSHCTVGVGVPLAAAVKLVVPPATTVSAAGCVVTTGGLNGLDGRCGGGAGDAARRIGEDRFVLVAVHGGSGPGDRQRAGAAAGINARIAQVGEAPLPVLTSHCTVGVG